MNLFFVIFAFYLAPAQNLCGDIFAPPFVESQIPTTFRTQVERLAPHLLKENSDLESLYIALLGEATSWRYAKQPLPPEIDNLLTQNYSKRYDVPIHSDGRSLFYSNALTSLYGRVAWEWKQQQVEKLIGREIPREILGTVQALMDSFAPAFGLSSDSLTVSSMREYFQKREWESYPWDAAIEIARLWYASPESAAGFTQFYRWYEAQTGLPAIEFQHLQRLYLALMKKPTAVFCCKSSSACPACPHNRRWLKDKSEDL